MKAREERFREVQEFMIEFEKEKANDIAEIPERADVINIIENLIVL